MLSLQGQETHYWFHNYGVVSSLKGGIETGGIRNAAAIYYNPGAMAFISGEYFEGQADVFSIESINIKNAAGDGVDLDYFTADVSPSLIAYMKRSKKNPRITFAFGVMTRYNSNISFVIEHEQKGNYLLPDEETEIYQGQVRYDNRVRESWALGSVAYRLSDRVGIGLGTNLFIRAQEYFKAYNAFAFPEDEYGQQPFFTALTSQATEEKFNARVMGFIFKPSIDIDLDDLKIGLTLSTPAISLGLLNNYAYRSQYGVLPDVSPDKIAATDSNNNFSGVYKTPFSANIGAEYDLGRLLIGFSAEWFSKVDTYEMIKPNGRSVEPEFPTSPNEEYAMPKMAHKSVTNWGVSLSYDLKEWISLIGSYRIDNNFFDDEALDRNTDFVPNMTYWDIQHVTTGIKMQSKKLKLTVGVDYGFGSSKDDLQFVNMTNASQENALFGDLNTDTRTSYDNLSFTIGFNLNIDSNMDSP